MHLKPCVYVTATCQSNTEAGFTFIYSTVH